MGPFSEAFLFTALEATSPSERDVLFLFFCSAIVLGTNAPRVFGALQSVEGGMCSLFLVWDVYIVV
jgi:hypothetical protein